MDRFLGCKRSTYTRVNTVLIFPAISSSIFIPKQGCHLSQNCLVCESKVIFVLSHARYSLDTTIERKLSPSTIHFPAASTVLCKSNANEFRRNSRLFGAFRSNFAQDDSSMKFPHFFMTPIVLIRAIFRTIICFAR